MNIQQGNSLIPHTKNLGGRTDQIKSKLGQVYGRKLTAQGQSLGQTVE